MKNTQKQIDNVTSFLQNNEGVYLYRPLFNKAVLWFAALCFFGLLIGIHDLLFDPHISNFETASTYIMLITSLYFIWSCIVMAKKFKEIRIDLEGITILPFGFRLASHEIEVIRHSANYAGAETIKVKSKAPCLLFHAMAWSLGRTVTIAFNKRLLTPVAPQN